MEKEHRWRPYATMEDRYRKYYVWKRTIGEVSDYYAAYDTDEMPNNYATGFTSDFEDYVTRFNYTVVYRRKK